MKKKLTIFIVIILLISIGGLWVKTQKEKQDKLNKSLFNPEYFNSFERKKWSDLIKKDGAEKTYRAFKGTYQTTDFKTQHIAAHMFGNILYDARGIGGLTVCDSSFAYGCYHVFLTRVLIDKGFGYIKELNKICQDKFGKESFGCQHGIGHGLVEYLGYTQDKLDQALKYCEQTSYRDPFNGCFTGAFMEYNIPVITGTQKGIIEWRKFNEKNPYEPCADVLPKYQPSCYSQLGLWWYTVLDKDYVKIGKYCGAVVDRKNRNVCFYGLGIITATLSEYDLSKTKDRCGKMPDNDSRLLCLSGAYRSFYIYLPKRDFATDVCKDLKDSEKKLCLTDKYDFFDL